MRSYLDANCAHCHQPGVAVQVAFDARYQTPLHRQNLIWGRSRWPAVPRPSRFIVLPGDVTGSQLHRRVAEGTMPPLSSALVDREAAQLLASWIEQLAAR